MKKSILNEFINNFKNKSGDFSMTINQIKIGDNFSYIVFSEQSKRCVLIDPTYNADKPLEFISSNSLNLEYIILTHHHSDHTGDLVKVKSQIRCPVLGSSEGNISDHSFIDRLVLDGEILELDDIKLKFILTPGHTKDGLCVIVNSEAIITGDTLFIDDCGRCDLTDSSLPQMFKTLNEKILSLPDNLIVYPGHDYGPKPFDLLGNQKKTNGTLLVRSLEEFSKIP